MSFDSPLLDAQEVLEAFRESDIHLTELDLSRPDPRRWFEIYSQIFKCLTARPIDQATQSLCRVGMLQTAHPELFEEGFAQMAFTLCMRRALSSCGFEGFSIKDLICPTPKRVMLIASAFINASRHNQIRKAYIDERKQSIEESREAYESVFNRYKELKASVAKLNDIRDLREADIQKSQEELELAQSRLMDFNRQQEAEGRNVNELKVRLAERATQEESLKQQISVVKQEGEKLSHKIVQSPERFTQEQERLKKRVLDLKAELVQKEKIVAENRQRLEQTEEQRMAAEKVVKLCKEVQECLEKEKEAECEILKVTEDHSELCEEQNYLWTQDEDLADKLRIRQEQKRKMLLQMDVTKQQRHEELSGLREHKDKKEKDMNILCEEISQIKAKTAQLMEEINGIDQTMMEQKATWHEEFSQLLSEIDVLHTDVGNGYADFRGVMTDAS